MAYSKSQVNRAGRHAAEIFEMARSNGLLSVKDRVDEFRAAVQVIEWWRGEHAKPLSRVAANLRYYVAQEGKPTVAQRLKRTPTITDKLIREPTMKLSRMEDVGGVRAILPSQTAAYKVSSRLRKNWTITRFRDYVTEPKPSGYRALHLIGRNRGRFIEVQLRTPRQDQWANTVEGLAGILPGLKSGDGPNPLRDYFRAAAEGFALLDEGKPVSVSTFAKVNELKAAADTFIQGKNQ